MYVFTDDRQTFTLTQGLVSKANSSVDVIGLIPDTEYVFHVRSYTLLHSQNKNTVESHGNPIGDSQVTVRTLAEDESTTNEGCGCQATVPISHLPLGLICLIALGSLVRRRSRRAAQIYT